MARPYKPKPSYTYRESFPDFNNPGHFQSGEPLGYNIAWSGGSDSTALLKMALEITGDANKLNPYTMTMLPDLDYYQYWLEYAFRKWGVRVKHYQHWALSWYIRRGIFRPLADATFPRVILNDVERMVRADSGYRWIGYGYKAIDSLQRRGMMHQWPMGICQERSVFSPLKDWTGRHVKMALVKWRCGQVIQPEYRSRGIDLSPSCMSWLRKYWPGDYRKMLDMFPFAVAQADRWEANFSSNPVVEGDGKFPTAETNMVWTPDQDQYNILQDIKYISDNIDPLTEERIDKPVKPVTVRPGSIKKARNNCIAQLSQFRSAAEEAEQEDSSADSLYCI